MKPEEKKIDKKLRKARRNNAKLYPVYKMFSWDLLCFYSIEFLFYTMTKQVTASQVLIISAFYIIFKIISQVPAIIITDSIGKRNSMIFGNLLIALYLVILIFTQGIIGIIIANFICALGYSIKDLAETNLLYDSVATKGGEGIYTKLDSKGGSLYYYIDGIFCLVAGYLFVINNYIPIIICLGCVIISIILSFKFKEIYNVNKTDVDSIGKTIKQYGRDLKKSMGFILKSRRLKAYILFGAFFYGLIEVIGTYKSELLIVKGISEEQFSMIFACLSLLAGVSVTFSKKIHKNFKNRTLTFISLTYIFSCIIIGVIAWKFTNNIAIPIILILYAILKMCDSVWYIVKYKYLNNFTTDTNRSKVTFIYGLIGGITASTISVIGSKILEIFGVENAFLLVSLAFLVIMILILDYMRTRFGLKPNEYKKEDIEF